MCKFPKVFSIYMHKNKKDDDDNDKDDNYNDDDDLFPVPVIFNSL